MIPVDRETYAQYNKTQNETSNHIDSQASSSNLTTPCRSDQFNPNGTTVLSPDEESKKSIEDFLGKIDSTLAKTKKFVRNR